jgi:exopolysaccharide biosynthesis polyprenyl glycosylphosphotransferase
MSSNVGEKLSSMPGVLGDARVGPRPFPRARTWRRVTPFLITEAKGPAAGMRRDCIFRRMLFAADVIAIVGAFILTQRLAGSTKALHFTAISLLALPIPLVCAKIFGLYDRDEALIRKTTLDEVPKLFQVATLCALIAWLSDGLLIDGALSRSVVLLLWLTLACLLFLARSVARAIALRVAPVERCLFIGDEQSAQAIRSKMVCHGGVRARLVAHLDPERAAPWSMSAFSTDRLQEVRELAQTLDVHRAILAPSSSDAGEMLDLVRTLKAAGVRVSILPRLLQVVGSSVEFDDLHGVTLMGVRRFDLTRSSEIIKRSFDVLGSTLALVALAPLMAVIAVAIKLDSRGPVFFRQLRMGRHEAHFKLFKFRTMVVDAEAIKASLKHRNEVDEVLFKIADDPRITRIGALLRKTSLDELPQLFNVLLGEMSLVGPRPLILEEDQHVEGWHRRRLALHPGMTGHWQILGSSRVPLREMVAIDYLYVANWSLWTDIKILLRTVPFVIARRGL